MKNMLLVLLLIFWANTSFAQWIQQTSPTSANLHDVAFFDQRIGYAVGAKGTVLRTKNGGKEWQLMKSPDSSDLVSVVVLDSFTVIVTSAGGSRPPGIFKSTSGGVRWQKVMSDPLPFYAAATPKSELFTVSKKIYQSSDSGTTWLPRTNRLNSTSTYRHISFTDKNRGMVAGNIGGALTYSAEFLRTADGGQRWWHGDPFSFPDANGFSALSEIRGDTVFMFTNFYNGFQESDSSELVMLTNFTLRRTGMDSTWFFKSKVLHNRFRDQLFDCKFFDNGTAYAAGKKGIYAALDPSKRWFREYKSHTAVRSVYMVSEKKGFAVGDEGLILTRQVSLTPGNIIPGEDYHVNVYPNPASGKTTISFSLKTASTVSVQVTNEKGLPVYSVQERKYNSGKQTIYVNANLLNRGVHYITILVNGIPSAKKELLVIK